MIASKLSSFSAEANRGGESGTIARNEKEAKCSHFVRVFLCVEENGDEARTSS